MFQLHKLGEKIEHFNHFHSVYKRVNAELWNKYGKGKITKEELRDSRFQITLSKFESVDQRLSQELSDGYIALSPLQTTLFPGVKEALVDLKKENYRMHIITNGFSEVQHIKLKNSGIFEFFDLVLTSEEVGVTKPHREIFQEAMSRTNCKAEHAIMIGDDFKADIIGALNANWTAIHFDPEHKFKKERTVKRIRSFDQLPEYIALLPIVGG